MAKRKDIETASGESPETETAKSEALKADLPAVESPSISPAESIAAPVPEPFPAIEPAAPAIEAAAATTPRPRFALRRRHKRHALLAASVAIAAALGALIGALAAGGFGSPSPKTNVAGDDLRKMMQQSIAQLAKEVTTLKTGLEAANKSAHSQVTKITERFDPASEELVTGSISPPQTVTPTPIPRPAPRNAALDAQASARPPVVQGWSIRDARDGYVYVQGNGDIYQVAPGAPLPGLGPVESIKRQDGRWVVTTPKGIIVSMRDRRYFESF